MNPRFLPVLSALLLSVLASARAQDYIQVFGGYSHVGYSVYDLYSGPWMLQGFNGGGAPAPFKLSPIWEPRPTSVALTAPPTSTICAFTWVAHGFRPATEKSAPMGTLFSEVSPSTTRGTAAAQRRPLNSPRRRCGLLVYGTRW